MPRLLRTLLARRWSVPGEYSPPGLHQVIVSKRHFSTTSGVLEANVVPLSVPIFQVWGANTDVGKTLVSAGLLHQAAKEGYQVAQMQALFLKPVQTGYPEDSDARLISLVTGAATSLGDHAAELGRGRLEPASAPGSGVTAHTEYAWSQPVSPHVAVNNEGRPVGDKELQRAVGRHLVGFAAAASNSGPHLGLVETAGGPGSPGPSGRLQVAMKVAISSKLGLDPSVLLLEEALGLLGGCRPLRLPALLVGDGQLGGISATLAAHEMLTHRGYDVAAIALLEEGQGPTNSAAIQTHIAPSSKEATPVFSLPPCQPPRERQEGDPPAVDAQLAEWLETAAPMLKSLLKSLGDYHLGRVHELGRLAERNLGSVWYPFTQHTGLLPQQVTVVDARAGENLLVYKDDASQGGGERTESHFDACASWWTQGMTDELHGRLVSETMAGTARYGHVIHPNTALQPTVQLAEMLLASVGKGWAAKVFYSDDGSTAVEVALKMAFRKFWTDHPHLDLEGSSPDAPACEFRVLGIDGGYHGDTLGAMDAVAPSPYNGPSQYPWYKGRGLFLHAPYVGIVKGRWRLRGEAGGEVGAEGWDSLEELLEAAPGRTDAAARYRESMEAALDRYEGDAESSGQPCKIAACIIEPILQGAGGMLLIDPLYQQTLVEVARSRRIPVIFDEVFTGLWRLGRPCAAELLGVQPDIACYAKLLTGGLLPLSATLASQAVFEAFAGDSKLDALLHGHSYSGHACGASAGVSALSIFSSPSLNPALAPGSGRLQELWPQPLVHQLSNTPGVESVVALGTVLAAELSTADGGGYASGASAEVVQRLRRRGIFARPLGSTVYLMVTPTTAPETAANLLQTLIEALTDTT